MQRRVKQKVENYTDTLKSNMKETTVDAFTKIERCVQDPEKCKNINAILQEMLENIYNIPQLSLSDDDFTRRKRAKNLVPFHERCHAKRAKNEQCTRRRKDGSNYCGTHSKGTPHGVVDATCSTSEKIKNISVWAEEICGIMYYIDDVNNVYNTEDIMLNKVNPKVIAIYKKQRTEDGKISYSIPEFNI